MALGEHMVAEAPLSPLVGGPDRRHIGDRELRRRVVFSTGRVCGTWGPRLRPDSEVFGRNATIVATGRPDLAFRLASVREDE